MRPSKAILLTASLLVASTALAQAPFDPTPTLKVYSRETIVDTTVTDNKGQPVHGLLKPDFTLKEDNKPQPIRGFAEYSSAAPTTAPAPHKLPPNVYTNLQPPSPSSAVNILLLDFINTAPVYDKQLSPILPNPGEDLRHAVGAQHLVKQEAMKYIATMPPGTRVAVLGMSTSLRILQGFTSDPALLRAAIDTMEYNTDARASTGDQLCAQSVMRNRMTLESLDQIAVDLAGTKGRKNLLWFTIGIPQVTDPNTHSTCLPDYYPSLTRMYGLLTEAQVAVYPIDARGIPPTIDEAVAGPNANVVAALNNFIREISEEQLSMDTIAEATGGTAFYNNNDLAGLITKAIARGSDYYTLTYVPPSTKYDGRYHTIKLAVDQPGLHLVYRKGYAAEDPAILRPPPALTFAATLPATAGTPDPEALMRTAMGRNLPTSTELLFDVQVEPSTEPRKPTDPPIMGILDPKLKEKTLTRYGFEYVFPARQIAFTTTSDGTQKSSLEFDIAAYDAEGKLVTSLSQSIQPTLTPDQHQQLLKGPFRFFQQLDLPPGALFLRIGILDATSSKVGTLEIPLTVPQK